MIMEGRDHDDHGHGLPWLPSQPSSQPPASNRHHSMENSNVSLQNPYFRYPSCQNPNSPNLATQNQSGVLFHPAYSFSRFLMEPGVYANTSPSFHHFAHDQNPENGLSRQLNQAAPAPPRQYHYPSLDQTNSSSRTSFPIQNYENLDLQSGLERLKIDDFGLSRPNNSTASTNRDATTNNNGFPLQQWSDQSRNIEPNHGNAARRFMFDHLGSSINGSQSISASAAALSSRYNNNFDIRPRPNRGHYSSINGLRGMIVLVAKDEQGCRFLRKKVDERNPFDIEMILSEVKDDMNELMRHQSANYLIQKLIGVLNEEQMTEFILSIVNSQERLFSICDDLTGSRVIQKLFDASEDPQRQLLTLEQKSLIVSALKNITVALCKSTHGNHVIKRCLLNFPYEFTKDLVEEVAESCLNLATDRSGCCLLQDCINYAQEDLKERLIADVVSNALFLSDHPYGNYVVQYVLGLKIPQVTGDILAEFAGNYFTLSQGKCSSNVVEKCLLESGEEQSTGIMNEIIGHPNIFELMLNPFGNYVIQTAWTLSQGRSIRQTLQDLVEMHSKFLQSHIYGKKVLAKVRGNKNCFYNRVSM